MDTSSDSWLTRLPLGRSRPLVGVMAAAAITAAAAVLRQLLDGVLPPGFPYVTFFPAVVLSAFLFGVRAGVVSAIIGMLASWYWFIPPAGFGLTLGVAMALALYLFVVVVDIVLINWMQAAHARLHREREQNRELAETRATLFQELQHRVGNNLQMVGSMLALQKRGLSGEAAQAIGEAAQRIALIGTMQRDLYHAEGTALGLRDLVEKVCTETIRAHGRDDIILTVTGDTAIGLSPTRAIPASVVVAETVANAIEHGLGASGGLLAAHVAETGKEFVVTISDNGHGLPADFELEQSRSLGLRLAMALARQVSGTYVLTREDDLTVARLSIGPEQPAFA